MVWYALKNLINIKKFLPFILSKSYGEKFQKFVWETKTKQTVMCPSEFTFEFQSSEAVWCFVVITALLASASAGHTDWTSPDCDCLLTAGTLETVSTEHCTLNHKKKINTSSLVLTNSVVIQVLRFVFACFSFLDDNFLSEIPQGRNASDI